MNANQMIQETIIQTFITYFNRLARRYEPRATIVSENNKPLMNADKRRFVDIFYNPISGIRLSPGVAGNGIIEN